MAAGRLRPLLCLNQMCKAAEGTNATTTTDFMIKRDSAVPYGDRGYCSLQALLPRANTTHRICMACRSPTLSTIYNHAAATS